MSIFHQQGRRTFGTPRKTALPGKGGTGMYYLNTGRLRVEIAAPEEVSRITSRFDSCGYITEVILDRTFRFCASEPNNMKHPSSGGRGLCSEFTFNAFSEAMLGEYYPKLGVGLLCKTEDEYRFYQKYQGVPFQTETELGENWIRFITYPSPCRGYAASVIRCVTVKENLLSLDTELKNVGERPLPVEEYCHNFLSLDGMALSSEYSISFPNARMLEDAVSASARKEVFRVRGNTVEVAKNDLQPAKFKLDQNHLENSDVFRWKLRHRGAGICVEGTAHFRPTSVAVWLDDHMICPEVFYSMLLMPGQSCTWRRGWRFLDERAGTKGEMIDDETS